MLINFDNLKSWSGSGCPSLVTLDNGIINVSVSRNQVKIQEHLTVSTERLFTVTLHHFLDHCILDNYCRWHTNTLYNSVTLCQVLCFLNHIMLKSLYCHSLLIMLCFCVCHRPLKITCSELPSTYIRCLRLISWLSGQGRVTSSESLWTYLLWVRSALSMKCQDPTLNEPTHTFEISYRYHWPASPPILFWLCVNM